MCRGSCFNLISIDRRGETSLATPSTLYESQELQVGRPSFLVVVLIGGGALRRHIFPSLVVEPPSSLPSSFLFFFSDVSPSTTATHAKIHFHSLSLSFPLYGARATTTTVYTIISDNSDDQKRPAVGMLAVSAAPFPSRNDGDVVVPRCLMLCEGGRISEEKGFSFIFSSSSSCHPYIMSRCIYKRLFVSLAHRCGDFVINTVGVVAPRTLSPCTVTIDAVPFSLSLFLLG